MLGNPIKPKEVKIGFMTGGHISRRKFLVQFRQTLRFLRYVRTMSILATRRARM